LKKKLLDGDNSPNPLFHDGIPSPTPLFMGFSF